MAIVPTGNIFKGFEFDGESSKEYGVYITGEAAYNAPERAVEMITIPNRNGAFTLDQGRFENIEVIYPAGVFADSEIDFAQAISDFRNFLCSKRGYCRLVDEYNPNEYRMAIYKSGLEVSPAQLKAGEFEIIFDCMPQRFLTSGESIVSLSSGGTISNPTQFEARPMVEAYGYGKFNVGGCEIELIHQDLGQVVLTDAVNAMGSTLVIDYSQTPINPGDTMTLKSKGLEVGIKIEGTTYPNRYIYLIPSFSGSSYVYAFPGYDTETLMARSVTGFITLPRLFTFTAFPTSAQTQTLSNIHVEFDTDGTGGFNSNYVNFGITITNSSNGKITIAATATDEPSSPFTGSITGISAQALDAYSTVHGLGNPTYVDSETGEAYMIRNSMIVSLNDTVIIGKDLPVLPPGATSVTFDNTITKFDIIPRWWKI